MQGTHWTELTEYRGPPNGRIRDDLLVRGHEEVTVYQETRVICQVSANREKKRADRLNHMKPNGVNPMRLSGVSSGLTLRN